MKLIFKREELCEAVAPLLCGVSSKVTLSAVDGILIEAKTSGECVMTTYDMEKGMRLSVQADVVEEGSFIINATKFMHTIRAMSGHDIVLTVDDKLCATIVSGKSSHTMSALPGSDFPDIPRLTSPRGFTVSQKVVKSMMAKCMYAMGVNDQRPILNGLYGMVKGSTFTTVACDSFKMAVCTANTDLENISEESEGAELNFKFIVPNKSVNELYKLLDDKDEEARLGIHLNKKNMIFSLGDKLFFTRIIEGDYIDYDRIVIKNHRIAVYTDREMLIEALERAALITEEKVVGSVRSHVRLEIEGNVLKVMANSSIGSSYDEIPVGHEGDDLVIAFNNRYLMDSLRACTAERIRLSLSTALTSINIEPASDDANAGEESELFMLLPVRMKE